VDQEGSFKEEVDRHQRINLDSAVSGAHRKRIVAGANGILDCPAIPATTMPIAGSTTIGAGSVLHKAPVVSPKPQSRQ
jgi:hypothetical protein